MLVYLVFIFACEYFSFLLFVVYCGLREIFVKENYLSSNLARLV